MRSSTGKQALVWGGLLILFGTTMLVESFVELSAWAWVAVLAAGGLGAFVVYLMDLSDWGYLIPAYVLWAIAAMIALITLNVLQDEFIAGYVLAAIALPFLATFVRNREQWWALIPSYVLLAVGLMVVLIGVGVLDDLVIPAYVMFAIAIPFLVVFARDTEQWWALIPGGITAIIGFSFLLAENLIQYVGAAVLIIAGAWILMRQFIRREPQGEAPEPVSEEVEGFPEVD